jgi:hypothetical protein
MSSLENGGPQTKYEFRGRFGAAPSTAQTEEVPHEEIDHFVRGILGLIKEK